jgi:hypothetical protein
MEDFKFQIKNCQKKNKKNKIMQDFEKENDYCTHIAQLQYSH